MAETGQSGAGGRALYGPRLEGTGRWGGEGGAPEARVLRAHRQAGGGVLIRAHVHRRNIAPVVLVLEVRPVPDVVASAVGSSMPPA
ncbi:hypothetical protein CP973_21390 [Streptomyces albofaciens JCM 4342]|nr:hypothetical protein CP973_21390 [Streptomyces albofaciens JCM 4342]